MILKFRAFLRRNGQLCPIVLATSGVIFFGPSGFPVGTPKMLCLTPWKSTESAYGSSHGHLTTRLAAVKGSLAWLGGLAALDACCAPWCTAAMR